jgi:hypothetical protein
MPQAGSAGFQPAPNEESGQDGRAPSGEFSNLKILGPRFKGTMCPKETCERCEKKLDKPILPMLIS